MTPLRELSTETRLTSLRALVGYYNANPTYLTPGERAWMEQVEWLLTENDRLITRYVKRGSAK